MAEKTIAGLKVRIDIPEDKVLTGILIYKTDTKNEFILYAECDICNSGVTTHCYEIIEIKELKNN